MEVGNMDIQGELTVDHALTGVCKRGYETSTYSIPATSTYEWEIDLGKSGYKSAILQILYGSLIGTGNFGGSVIAFEEEDETACMAGAMYAGVYSRLAGTPNLGVLYKGIELRDVFIDNSSGNSKLVLEFYNTSSTSRALSHKVCYEAYQ